MPNSLDPDQARRSVGPDLVSKCLQRFNISRRNWHVEFQTVFNSLISAYETGRWSKIELGFSQSG